MTIKDQGQTPGFRRVRMFMQKCGQSTPDVPTEPTPDERVRMAKVLFEEVEEAIFKGLGISIIPAIDGGNCGDGIQKYEKRFVVTAPFNMVEAIDGALDTIVTARAIMIGCGVADVALEYEVDMNNLEKFGPGSYRREDGKHCKPPGHPAPDIAGLLKKQGWTG